MNKIFEDKTINNRYNFIDSSKGIGILLVILGHLISLNSNLELSIYSFHMPFFFIVSGMFANTDDISFLDYLKKKTKQLMLPYLFIYMVGIVVTLIVPFFSNPSFKEIVYGFIFDPSSVHVGATWFLPCLYFVSLFYYPFYKIIVKNFNFVIIFAVILALLISPMIVQKLHFLLPFKMDVSLFCLPMYFFGRLLKQKIIDIDSFGFFRKALITITCLMVIIVIPQYNGLVGVVNNSFGNNELLYIYTSICGSFLLITLGSYMENNVFFKYIGKNSLFIFGFHFILIDLYSWILSYIYNTDIRCQRNLNVWQIIIGFVFITLILVFLSFCFNKVKFIIKNKHLS